MHTLHDVKNSCEQETMYSNSLPTFDVSREEVTVSLAIPLWKHYWGCPLLHNACTVCAPGTHGSFTSFEGLEYQQLK